MVSDKKEATCGIQVIGSLQCEPCGGTGDVAMAIKSAPGPVALASNALVNQKVRRTMQEAAPRYDIHILCRGGG
jgi:hypothetical protein